MPIKMPTTKDGRRTGGVSQRAAFNDDAKVCIFVEIYKSLI